MLRGKENGKVVNDSRIVTSVSKTLDFGTDYNEYMDLAHLDTLHFVVSNTTEAGIVLDKNDNFDGLSSTYPGKLTKFLYERYTAFLGAEDKGLIILTVELIEENGKKLKETEDVSYCIVQVANFEWHFDEIDIDEFYSEVKDYNPDIMIMFFGANVSRDYDNALNPKITFGEKYDELRNYLKCDNTIVIHSQGYYICPKLDAEKEAVANKYGEELQTKYDATNLTALRVYLLNN